MWTSNLDRWAVRLVLSLHWRKSSVVAERIKTFEATEDDSAWQLLHACTKIEAPKMRAKLFLQAMEEMHHAEVFRALYKQTSGKTLDKIKVPRKALFQSQEPWKLLAYCAIGESSAARRFRHIAEHLDAGPFQTSLQKILEEEEGHIELANHLVEDTGASASQVRWELRRIQAVRVWESWLRIGRTVTAFTSRIFLSLTYFGIGSWLRKGEDS